MSNVETVSAVAAIASEASFVRAVAWAQANPGLALFLSAVLAGLFAQATRISMYAWYVLTIAGAYVVADALGSRLYFWTFLLGMGTALAEIIGKFPDEPMKAVKTTHGVVYHVINGVIAAFALKIYWLTFPQSSGDLDQLKAVAVSGLGSMLIMRSKFFNLKVEGQDVSFGPEQIIKVFLNFMQGAIDRVRAQDRIDFVKAKLFNVDFDKALPYCRTMLNASQTLGKSELDDFEAEIAALQTATADTQFRSYRLGFLLLNLKGEDYVSKLFENVPSEWQIKAPAPDSEAANDGIGGLMSLVARKPAEKTLLYFAYGSSMSSERFLQRLRWFDAKSKRSLKATKPQRGVLEGYRLAFNKPDDPDNPTHGYANLVRNEGSSVEGVVYHLSSKALEFLDETEAGYRRVTVEVDVEGKKVSAECYVADGTRDDLKPSKEYLGFVVRGAREQGSSPEYIAMLERTEAVDVPASKRILAPYQVSPSSPPSAPPSSAPPPTPLQKPEAAPSSRGL